MKESLALKAANVQFTEVYNNEHVIYNKEQLNVEHHWLNF